MGWRRRQRGATLSFAALICLAVSACGSSRPAGPPTVNVSLLAPMNHAIVGVRAIKVLGSVSPDNALVFISGHRVRAHHGEFRMPYVLHRRVTHIRIVAVAPGYRKAALETTVRYSANRAALPVPLQQHSRRPASFEAKAERICLAVTNQVTSFPPVSAANFTSITTQTEHILAKQLHQLGALHAPLLKASLYGELLGEMTEYAHDYKTIVSDIVHGDRQQLGETALQVQSLVPRTRATATRLGIPDCGTVLIGEIGIPASG
jgi:hypothetical protein